MPRFGRTAPGRRTGGLGAFGRKAEGPVKVPAAPRRRTCFCFYLEVWQPLGRSDAAPVHCALAPPPLPPFVGGLGLANAVPVEDRPNTRVSPPMNRFIQIAFGFSVWGCRI